jgi:ribonuclease E
MAKTRVHLMAKELGLDTKDLIAQLEKLGIRGRKAQSSLEDDEVSRLRTALAEQEKPQVHVGEEKVVADRVVTADDESLGEIQARETIVERRVRANVIRRRTSRIEVIPEAAEKSQAEEAVPPSAGEATPTAEELPHHAEPDAESFQEFASDLQTDFSDDLISEEETAAEPVTSAPQVPEETVLKPAPEQKPVEVQEESPRGARILGRIDLKRTMRVEPAPTPVPRRPPVPGGAAVKPPPGAESLKPPRDGEVAKTEGAS